jgi:hypothetical protein
MTLTILCRWIFNGAAALSLALCVLLAALWARSLGHFELVHWEHNRWQQANDLRHNTVSLAWYPRTFQLAVAQLQCDPEFFESYPTSAVQDYREMFPAGSRWQFFFREDSKFPEKFGYGAGFHAEHRSFRPQSADDRYVLSVRPWLPTLLAAILPAIWLIQYRRRRGLLWQFGLRELLLSVTAMAALLGGALWLMR